MSSEGFKSKRSLAFVLIAVVLFVVATGLVVVLNVAILRQLLAFLLLTFLPGVLILFILKLDKLGLIEKIVFSVGLSLSFLMLFGLLLNSVSLTLGYREPLSTIPLVISVTVATIILTVLAFISNRNIAFSFLSLQLTMREKMLLMVPSLFPLLSIVGMRVMNLSDNNTLLILLLLLIPAYVIFISFYRHKVSPRLYPVLLFLISISVLLLIALRSNHIVGSDLHVAYYIFQLTLDNQYWSVTASGLTDALLSISLLPSIYQVFTNINPEYLFKVLYALLFSVSPLVVYIISRKYLGAFYAFIASFFFMSQFYFLWTTGAAQTNMSIFFFALTVMVLLHDDINELVKRILFIPLAMSSIVSHYSVSYIFFFILLSTWVIIRVAPLVIRRQRKEAASPSNPAAEHNLRSLVDRVAPGSNSAISGPRVAGVTQLSLQMRVTLTVVELFFLLLFFWYAQVTAAAFGVGVGLIQSTLTNLNQWFLVEAKGAEIVGAMGQTPLPTIPQQQRFVFSWLTVGLVALGMLITAVRYKRMLALPGSVNSVRTFLQSRLSIEYFALSLSCGVVLVTAVVLPYILEEYSLGRMYFQTMVVLAPFFVIGSMTLAGWLRTRPHWIILLVLIPFFMLTTGTMDQLFGVPSSITLNSTGHEYDLWYIREQESSAGGWIKNYGGEKPNIYPWSMDRTLVSQARVTEEQIKPFLKEYQRGKPLDGYIYLSDKDITVDKVLTEYPYIFADKNKIYTSGGAEIYR